MASDRGAAKSLHMEASFAMDHSNNVIVVLRHPKSKPSLRTGIGREPADALEDALQHHVRFASSSDERDACVASLLGRDVRLRLDSSRQVSLVA